MLGVLGAAIVAVSAIYYAVDVFRGGTRPQRSSWCVWAVTGVVGFGTARAGGAGPGAYAAAVDALACVLTFAVSLHPRLGKPGGQRRDLVLVALALAGTALWRWGPLSVGAAALCAIGCEIIALWPTVREAWRQPRLESLPSWAADFVGNTLCLCAVGRAGVAALAYPAYLVGATIIVVAVLVLRRPASGVPSARVSDVALSLTRA